MQNIQPDIFTLTCMVMMNTMLWDMTKKYLYIVDPSTREDWSLTLWAYLYMLEGVGTCWYALLFFGERADRIAQYMIVALAMLLYCRITLPHLNRRDRRIWNYKVMTGQEVVFPRPWYREMGED